MLLKSAIFGRRAAWIVAALAPASPLRAEVFLVNAARISELALTQRPPVLSGWRPLTEAGTLASYGPDQPAIARRSAAYVQRILKGAKPGDLSVEQATKFELVINIKTAKALGLTIPQPLLLRADEAIQ
jgi:putative tryptophan/tyrosine transport system substrate-binding protein